MAPKGALPEAGFARYGNKKSSVGAGGREEDVVVDVVSSYDSCLVLVVAMEKWGAGMLWRLMAALTGIGGVIRLAYCWWGLMLGSGATGGGSAAMCISGAWVGAASCS